MPEVLGEPPSPRTALFWNGTAWQWARVDAAGHLQVDVLSTAMDALAATAANQAIMITALQLIDNLVVALGGPGNARLIVRGEDQLFSFKGVLAKHIGAVVSGADGYIDSSPVPANEIWVVTAAIANDSTTAPTAIRIGVLHDAVAYLFQDETRAFAIGEGSDWAGHVYLDVDDCIRAYFTGSLVGDQCYIDLLGYRMTLEV